MNNKLILALEDCLQSMQDGASLETVLARYPLLSAELQHLLLAAQAAQSVDPEPIPQKAFNAGRLHLFAQVNDLRRTQATRKGLTPGLRFALITAVVLVFLVVSGNGLLRASASSLPDDPLYGIKRTAEIIQLDLTFDPDQKAALEDKYYQRRIDETESLLVSQRTVEVKFSGLVDAQLTDGWLVSGIQVILNPQTEVDGQIVINAHVEVEGITQPNGTVLAQKIRLETSGNGSPDSSGSDEEQATKTSQPEDGVSNSGSGSGDSGSGSSTQESNSGSNSGSGDATKTPEPTRTPEPTKFDAPTKTPEPTKTREPTRTPEPTRTAEPTN